MKEVDEALARAFAKREQSDPRPKVPPAPHWPVRCAKYRISLGSFTGHGGAIGRASMAASGSYSRARMGRPI